MNQFIKYVGMDVHKATIAVSVAQSGGGEVRYFGEIANTPAAVEKLVKQLRKDVGELKFCYEAWTMRVQPSSPTDLDGLGLPGRSPFNDPEEGGRPGKDGPA